MNEINPLINNIGFNIPKNALQKPNCNSYQQQVNYAPAPVYLQAPYGVNMVNFVKVGIDKLPNGKELHKYKLINGQTLGIVQGAGNPSIMTRVGVGAMDEGGFPKGIAHFIEHSLYHSSKNFQDIEKQCDIIASYNNAGTGYKDTTYQLDLASDSLEDLKKAIDLQSDMLLYPEFSKIDKEKNIVKAEVEDGLNNEYVKLSQELVKRVLGLPSDSIMEIAGSVESVDAITMDDLKKFHHKFYQPSNFSTILATKHNPDEVAKIVADAFVSKSPKMQTPIVKTSPVPVVKQTRVDLISQVSNDGACEFVFYVPNGNNPHIHAQLQMICEILSSRYDLDAYYYNMRDGLVEITLAVGGLKNSSVEEKNQTVYQIFKDLIANPPNDEELNEIKKNIITDIDSGFSKTSEEAINTIYETYYDCGYASIEDRKNIINSLTSHDIINTFVGCFDLNNVAVSALHPKEATQEDLISTHQNYKKLSEPIFVPKNKTNNIYRFEQRSEQLSQKKIYSTTLNNNSKLIFLDSPSDECRIHWGVDASTRISSNPALAYILYFLPSNNIGSTDGIIFDVDSVKFLQECKEEELEEKINFMKRFSNLSFTQKDLEKAKERVLKELQYSQVDLQDDFKEFLYGRKYTKDLDFIAQEVSKMTLEEVVEGFNEIVSNSNSTIIVQAPISKNPALMNKIANLFDSTGFSFKKGTDASFYKNENPIECLIRVDNTNQNELSKVYDIPLSGNIKDVYAFRLLAEVLSSKNFDLIREKEGLAYSSCSYLKQNGHLGSIVLSTNASCNNKGDAKKIFDSYDYNISEILSGNISQEEFQIAKNKIKGFIISKFSDNESLSISGMANSLTQSNFDNVDKIAQVIDSLTIQDIQQAAQFVFSKKPRYFINTTQKTYDENSQLFESLGKVEKRIY
ncbi:MAG: insulinase family protein [Candidatus Gastranaerophilales bacterium]|nr:insulinase family protein [Candidatus Gastranaerophilales bacterium]